MYNIIYYSNKKDETTRFMRGVSPLKLLYVIHHSFGLRQKKENYINNKITKKIIHFIFPRFAHVITNNRCKCVKQELGNWGFFSFRENGRPWYTRNGGVNKGKKKLPAKVVAFPSTLFFYFNLHDEDL